MTDEALSMPLWVELLSARIAPWGFDPNISHYPMTGRLREPSSRPRCSAPRRSFSPICNPVKMSPPRSAEFVAFRRKRLFDFRSTPGSFMYSMIKGSRFRRYGRGARITLRAAKKREVGGEKKEAGSKNLEARRGAGEAHSAPSALQIANSKSQIADSR